MFLSRRDEQSNATRDALITAATELFGSDGYHGTGVEEIARAARVTRGALYHHFDDKRSLFDAVVVALQTEVAVFVESKARQQDDKWIRMRVGFNAYLEACLNPAFQRLVIRESPVVLGVTRFKEIDAENARRLLVVPLTDLNNAGVLDVPDIYVLAHLMSAMMREAAMLMDHADDPVRLRKNSIDIVVRLLEGYRQV